MESYNNNSNNNKYMHKKISKRFISIASQANLIYRIYVNTIISAVLKKNTRAKFRLVPTHCVIAYTRDHYKMIYYE